MKELKTKWELYFFEQNSVKIDKPSELLGSGCACILCSVPGNVELDLSAAGYLPADLYMGENIRQAEKFETYEWWYMASFAAEAPEENQRLFLHFEGVDCFAEVYLNDFKIGESDNMFIPFEFDITPYLKGGKNTLAVRLRSAVLEENNIDTELYTMANLWKRQTQSAYVRKAPHSYGWDIMPRAVSAGIWRGVYLDYRDDFYIKQLYAAARSISEEKAELLVMYELSLPQSAFGKKIEVSIEGVCADSSFKAVNSIRSKAGSFIASVEKPKLWWPRGYGKAELYKTSFSVFLDGEEKAKKEFNLGIRTVTLEHTDVTDGKNGYFRFIVNGEEIMVKGSNWVPMDVYHSRDRQRYKKALDLAEDIGCNMLRCWGGTVYEDHEFFDFCDKHGIMVWQDFSMACFLYPQDVDFQNKIKKEAQTIVRRLRQHPSIVLWAGDNECDWVLSRHQNPNMTNVITREILPSVVLNNDFFRPYLPSSPFVSEKASGESDMPEDHLWGCRIYYKSDYYKNSNAHFVSETGYHGCPSVKSLKKFIEPQALWHYKDNSQWIFHSSDQNNDPSRVMLMENQILQMFGIYASDLDEFSLLSQLSQAEAMKYFIERVRIDRPRKSGIIWWNLIDGWPQLSDAVVDYYYEKKIAYYYIKKSQRPFCIFLSEPNENEQNVVAANDTNDLSSGSVVIYDGETREEIFAADFSVGKNQNKKLGVIKTDYSQKRLLIIKWSNNGERGGNHYISGFVPFDAKRFISWYEIIKKELMSDYEQG